jgi:hypothetical protein
VDDTTQPCASSEPIRSTEVVDREYVDTELRARIANWVQKFEEYFIFTLILGALLNALQILLPE